MPRPLNKLVMLSLYYVVEAGGRMTYRDLANMLTMHIDDEQAYNARLKKLRNNPSETRAETVWRGKLHIARQIIARSLWAGRLVAFGPKGEREVALGEPPGTSGRYSRSQSWNEYFVSIRAAIDEDLHPTRHDFADSEGEERVISSGYGYGEFEEYPTPDYRPRRYRGVREDSTVQ